MGFVSVLEAVDRLEEMAEAGRHPQEVAATATEIVAGWWLGAAGDAEPDRLVLLVQELRRWCRVTCNQYAWRWEQLQRAGYPDQADEARRWAEALDQAQRVLHLYD
ncbi:MAG TPA: hypothetical protein VGC80_17620 [Acetobacteraceae bacterium]